MAKVRALRGVCIGVGQHLAAGETADLEEPTVRFLVGIGAVERAADVDQATEDQPRPAKAGKKDSSS